MTTTRRTHPRHRSRLSATTLGTLQILACAALLASCDDVSGQQKPERPAAQQPTPEVPTAPEPTATQPVVRDADGKLLWHRPRTERRKAERNRLIDRHIVRPGAFSPPIRHQRVIQALRDVPRHEFVPPERQATAYVDSPLPIGYGQTISQPYIVALMTDRLELQPGRKVLEIGTGSGYQAAVLSELTPHVYTIEIVKPLYKQVVERFKKLEYRTIKTKQADGYDGWPEHGPFDAIIVTCAAGHIPPPLWDQLKPGGRMVIPVGAVYETQRLLVLTKQPNGKRKSQNILPVRFVPMTGKSQQR